MSDYIKYTIFIIAALIWYIVFKISKKRMLNNSNLSMNYNKKMIFVLIMIYLIIMLFPLNSLLKFQTVEKALHYYYPSAKIIEKYDYDNNVVILSKKRKLFSSEDSPANLDIFKKVGTKWNLDVNQKRTLKVYDRYTITTISSSDKSISGITVSYVTENHDKVSTITDSLGANYDISEYRDVADGVVIVQHLKLYNRVLDNNYTIYLDNQPYQPFKD